MSENKLLIAILRQAMEDRQRTIYALENTIRKLEKEDTPRVEEETEKRSKF